METATPFALVWRRPPLRAGTWETEREVISSTPMEAARLGVLHL
ncbi:hypothetical protein ACP70R_013291 [Stipagrostis hirtigluma subsp. patula]